MNKSQKDLRHNQINTKLSFYVHKKPQSNVFVPCKKIKFLKNK